MSNPTPSLRRRLWSCRWPAMRLVIAISLLWILAGDTGARLARLQLASLPDFDFLAEVKQLREQGRYSEAELIAQEGMTRADAQTVGELAKELRAVRDERSSLLRRLRDFGFGALSGQGITLESCAGAITADLFIVGDVRDLLIQATKLVVDGEIDTLVTALSAAGVVTTVAPEIDAGAAALKLARKTGALTRGMAESITAMVKAKAAGPVRELLAAVGTLGGKVGLGPAIRLIRLADEPADVVRMAEMTKRVGGAAAYSALHVTGKSGAITLKAAPVGAEAAHDTLILAAGAKGRAGANWLTGPAARRLLTPHPILGITKSLAKGTLQRFIAEAVASLDGLVWWLMPLLGAWAVIETGILARRLWPPKPATAVAGVAAAG